MEISDPHIAQPGSADGERIRIAIDPQHLDPCLTESSRMPAVAQRGVNGSAGTAGSLEHRQQEYRQMVCGGRVGPVRLHGLKHNTPSEGRGGYTSSERG